jgi:hypothetical protein
MRCQRLVLLLEFSREQFGTPQMRCHANANAVQWIGAERHLVRDIIFASYSLLGTSQNEL